MWQSVWQSVAISGNQWQTVRRLLEELDAWLVVLELDVVPRHALLNVELLLSCETVGRLSWWETVGTASAGGKRWAPPQLVGCLDEGGR